MIFSPDLFLAKPIRTNLAIFSYEDLEGNLDMK